MYADDLVILQLLRTCSGCDLRCDIKFNSQKSVVVTGRAKGDQVLQFPSFFVSSDI